MVGRTRMAFGGAVVMAIVGAVVAILMMAQAAPTSLGAAKATATSTTGVARVATKTLLPTATATTAPIPTEVPTRAPTPILTPTPPVGQRTTLHGTIASLISNGFLLQMSGGGTVTIMVNSQTTYQGAATSYSGLRQGLQAAVTGAYQDDGTFLATRVSTDD